MQNHLQAVEKFCSRVDRVRSYSIARLVKNGLTRRAVQLKFWETAALGTDDAKSNDGYGNNLKYFLNQSEATSFPKIQKSFEALPIPEELQRKFNLLVTSLNQWFEHSTPMKLMDTALTNKQVLEAFIESERPDQSKAQLLEECKINPEFFQLFQLQSILVMGQFMTYLESTADICREVLFLNLAKQDQAA